MALSYNHIRPLIHSEKSFSKWLGYFGLTIGMVILLTAVQMFVNINQLLREDVPKKAMGFDYISVSKVITNDNMGKDNRFTDQDINLLKSQPDISGVAPLYSNQFSAKATAGDILPFSTELFLESLDSSFLDTIPPGFHWAPGQVYVPLIMSSDFLEMYNVFAPSQGLPQVSAKTASSINIILECTGTLGNKNFRAGIVGLSDRVNSILVPESFLKWANLHFSGDSTTMISRVFIKTTDANNPDLIKFLDQHQFQINKDKVRFGRMKGILENTIGTIGSFGGLVILLALILFGFYLQLMIAKSKENINLLLILGYSPSWLSRSFAKTFLPVYVLIICLAVIVTSLGQLLFVNLPLSNERLSPVLHWSVWITALILLFLAMWWNIRMVRKEISGMYESH